MNNFYNEFDEVIYSMESRPLIFYAAMKMGRPVLDQSIDTACVSFDVVGTYMDFHFNPDFWDYLDTNNNKGFVVAHECLHVIMGHGMRSLTDEKLDPEDRSLINVALDLIVNHTLVNYFKFERTDKLNPFCWIDTIFKEPDKIDPEGTFEYYYDLLKKKENRSKNFDKMCEMSNAMNKFLDQFGNELSEALHDEMSQNVSSDDSDKIKQRANAYNRGRPGDPLIEGKNEDKIKSKPKINRKWANLIKKFTKVEYEDIECEQWSHRGRRHANLTNGMMLPSDRDDIAISRSRITVYFFLDASGSCWHLRKEFLDACKSLDPKRFDVRAFTRTTSVKEIKIDVDMVSWHGGGGSDDFACMERYIQKEIASGTLKKYPDAIFHITDGGDCAPSPFKSVENPDVWHWFLTEGGLKFSIPDGCHIHQLKDYTSND